MKVGSWISSPPRKTLESCVDVRRHVENLNEIDKGIKAQTLATYKATLQKALLAKRLPMDDPPDIEMWLGQYGTTKERYDMLVLRGP